MRHVDLDDFESSVRRLASKNRFISIAKEEEHTVRPSDTTVHALNAWPVGSKVTPALTISLKDSADRSTL